ncbi:MAG: DUF5675 family protein [Bacteroidota bacterium]
MLRLLRKLFPFIFGREPQDPPIVMIPKPVSPKPKLEKPIPPAPKKEEKPLPKPEPAPEEVPTLTETAETPDQETSEETKTEVPTGSGSASTEEGDLEVSVADGQTRVDIQRTEAGAADTLGKLYVNGKFSCYTLELPSPGDTAEHAIPAGTYTLALRNEGGKQATYWQRFKDVHQGMLHILEVPNHDFAYLSIGFDVGESLGSILVGQQTHLEGEKRQLLDSEQAYLALYQPLAAAVSAGQTVEVHISQA